MPKFKGSCGCYNREDARTIGLVPAIVWNDMLDRAEHFDTNPMWYDQSDAGERLGIPRQTINRAVKTLEEVGRITTKLGYRPNTTITTTWVTINADEAELRDNLDAQNEHPKDAQNEHPIYNDTNKTYSPVDVAEEEDEYDIPLANVTTKHVEISVYDTDDNGKTITVPHKVTSKEWNKAVRKWRKDNSQFVRIEFADTGDTVSLRPSQIKKWNVRPKNTPSYKKDSGFVYAKQ